MRPLLQQLPPPRGGARAAEYPPESVLAAALAAALAATRLLRCLHARGRACGQTGRAATRGRQRMLAAARTALRLRSAAGRRGPGLLPAMRDAPLPWSLAALGACWQRLWVRAGARLAMRRTCSSVSLLSGECERARGAGRAPDRRPGSARPGRHSPSLLRPRGAALGASPSSSPCARAGAAHQARHTHVTLAATVFAGAAAVLPGAAAVQFRLAGRRDAARARRAGGPPVRAHARQTPTPPAWVATARQVPGHCRCQRLALELRDGAHHRKH